MYLIMESTTNMWCLISQSATRIISWNRDSVNVEINEATGFVTISLKDKDIICFNGIVPVIWYRG